MPKPRYLVISPMKDEGLYLDQTLRSVVQQTITPARWVIVDDGSSDGSREKAAAYAQRFAWIDVLPAGAVTKRRPGSGVMLAFARGLATVDLDAYDFVVKLDCDLELPPHYFEDLFRQFEEEPQLGIASGVYAERRGEDWNVVSMPSYHAAGASKVLRRECFRAIGGFLAERGWDTVDEIRAQARGWQTAHFPNLVFFHLKPEGQGIGQLRTNVMHGEILQRTGGGSLILLLKTVRRFFSGHPPVLASLATLWGYLRAWMNRLPPLVTPEEARCYRRLLYRRLLPGSAASAAKFSPGANPASRSL